MHYTALHNTYPTHVSHLSETCLTSVWQLSDTFCVCLTPVLDLKECCNTVHNKSTGLMIVARNIEPQRW